MRFKVKWFTRHGRQKPPENKCSLGLCRHLSDFEALEYRPDLHHTCGHCAGILPWCAPVAAPHIVVPDPSHAVMPSGNAHPARRRHVTERPSTLALSNPRPRSGETTLDRILAMLLAILLAGGLAVTGQAEAKPSAYECDLNRLAAEAAATETLHSLRDSEKAKNTLIVGGSCLFLLSLAPLDGGITALACGLLSAATYVASSAPASAEVVKQAYREVRNPECITGDNPQ